MEGASRSRNSSAGQSQGRGQDIEDLKQDIPFFDEPAALDADLLVLGKSECQLDELAWDPDADVDADAPLEAAQPVDLEEDNYPDENESSVLGSDYAPSGSGSGANSFYQSPTPSTAGSGCDLMLRPPSSSMYHFNYRSPGSPLPVAIPGGGGPNSRGLHPYAHSPAHGAAPGFYPNMWYPNAPYGSGGSGGVGGGGAGGGSGGAVAGGRYMGYGAGGGVPSSGTGPGSMQGAYPGHSAHLHAMHHPYPQPHPHAHHPQHSHHLAHPHHQHPNETMMEMFQLSNR